MKKLKNNLRRALLMLLVLVFLAGPLGSPASEVRADGAEFDLDGSAFTQPEYDTMMMYFWHEGIPTVTKDKQGNYIQYPVLITWKDQYFLCTDANFQEELNETHKQQEKKNDHYKYIGASSDWNVIGGDGYEKWDRVWGNTDYYMRYLYDTTESSLLSKLGMDVNSLTTLGEAVSVTWPEGLPYIVATKPEANQYAIGMDKKAFVQNVWLVGTTRTWESIYTSAVWGSDKSQDGDVQWGLDYTSWKAEQFLDKNYTKSSNRHMYDVNTHKTYVYTEGAEQHYWTIKQDSKGLYHIWTTGENVMADFGRLSGSCGPSKNRDRTRDWFHANDVGRMSLYYKGSQIGVSAETIAYKDWKDRQCTVDNTDGYKVYYADPNIVSFYRNSFSVAKGQVVTLDGPCVLDNQCTVTVKDGGVLACSGWVINNGQINVEPGGMLILQDRDTATGDYQFGCISTVGVEAGTGSGRIACDGTIIVNRDCKLACAGTYGLKLGSMAQVVNYGQIITENLTVNGDHVIENRGDTSAVFAGWGVTDSGYALTRTRISGQSYNAKGNREKTCAVYVAKNAVYGDGAARFYVNKAVPYFQIDTEKGYVSGFVAPIGGTTSHEQPPLPDNFPICYDEDYGIAYIKVNDAIYTFDSMVGRWVNVEDGAHETFYDYRMPDVVEEYIYEKLPDGFVLSDGRVVGQEVNEDLYYDHHAGVFWFVEDTVIYYYEPKLQAYIHVEDLNTYCRYPKDLAPPPNYTLTDYIPVSSYRDLNLDYLFYSAGMTEIPASEVKPKVQKDSTGYYVMVQGYRLDWSAKDQLFIDAVGALPDEENFDENGNRLGLTVDQVNLNGYNPADPNAKPKVQVTAEGRYYVIVDGKTYYWYGNNIRSFFCGDPWNYEGKPISKDQVDLNGYTLP